MEPLNDVKKVANFFMKMEQGSQANARASQEKHKVIYLVAQEGNPTSNFAKVYETLVALRETMNVIIKAKNASKFKP